MASGEGAADGRQVLQQPGLAAIHGAGDPADGRRRLDQRRDAHRGDGRPKALVGAGHGGIDLVGPGAGGRAPRAVGVLAAQQELHAAADGPFQLGGGWPRGPASASARSRGGVLESPAPRPAPVAGRPARPAEHQASPSGDDAIFGVVPKFEALSSKVQALLFILGPFQQDFFSRGEPAEDFHLLVVSLAHGDGAFFGFVFFRLGGQVNEACSQVEVVGEDRLGRNRQGILLLVSDQSSRRRPCRASGPRPGRPGPG